jgi:EAL domain-containing protein (putative c-di-GMP-specific phosphodiesterase class I)
MPSSAFAPLGVDIESILRSRLIGVSFQPIFDLSTGDVFAFEALARVDRVVSRAPAQTIFRASAVVGKAEVLDRLCTQAAIGALGDLPDGSSLFVNLSLSAVASRSFVEDLVRDLEYAQLCPAHVVIEMTGDDGTGAQVDGRALESWKDRGFRIAMGGFIGTRSDMDLVSSVPFDYVEIDVTSSDPASSTRARMSYLSACVTRLRESGAEPIAVRIETIDDLRIAHHSGFFGAQGMFLREPEPFLNGAPRPLGTASATSVDAARL